VLEVQSQRVYIPVFLYLPYQIRVPLQWGMENVFRNVGALHLDLQVYTDLLFYFRDLLEKILILVNKHYRTLQWMLFQMLFTKIF
jgi:hypothetical protein